MVQGKQLNFVRTIIFLSKYLKGNYFKFISFCCGWLVQSAITIITPIIFGVMIDQIVYYGNITSFVSLGLVYVMITVYGCILYYFIYEIYAHILVTFTSEIKKVIFSHIMDAEASVMSESQTGELINIIQTYPNDCMDFVVRNIIHNLNGVLLIIFSAYYIFKINVYIGLLILICIPIGTYVNLVLGKKIRYYGGQRREKADGFMSWILELITGARDIRMLGAQEYVRNSFANKQLQINKINNKSKFLILTAEIVIDGSNMLIQLSIFGVMAYLMKAASLSIGNVMIVLAYYVILAREMKAFCIKYMDLQNRVAGVQRIKDFLDTKLETEREGSNRLVVKQGDINFTNVIFSYGDKEPVINGVSFHITPGERVAIVGQSGCGKTTLANLLLGMYVPQEGKIDIDGIDLRDCTLQSIRNEIGMVQQNSFIIDGTIRENILMGNDDISDEMIFSSCKQAGLGSLLEKLPDGIDTVIGKNGRLLSGGERQRISIARTYLRNAKIVILDEATSALDSETEETILDAWSTALEKKTSLVIAHRQSSVMLCDRVLMLEHGQIVLEGTPEEMLCQEKFRKLFAIKKEA